MHIRRYRTPRGRCPVDDYWDELSREERAEVLAVLEALEQYGVEAPLVSMRQIRGKLWELRILQTRIFYVIVRQNSMILLHAYKKQGQRAPIHEMTTALRRMRNVLEESFEP